MNEHEAAADAQLAEAPVIDTNATLRQRLAAYQRALRLTRAALAEALRGSSY